MCVCLWVWMWVGHLLSECVWLSGVLVGVHACVCVVEVLTWVQCVRYGVGVEAHAECLVSYACLYVR